MPRGTKRTICLALGAMLALGACSGSAATDPEEPRAEVRSMNQRIGGVWRLINYIPDEELSPALLLSMQGDKILIRFEDGMVRSLTSGLDFERRYRIESVNGNTFTVRVEEEGGITYEVIGQLDGLGTMNFQVMTEPWKGRGVLTREGPALRPGAAPADVE